MSSAPDPVPDTHHSITPYLIISGAAEAIAFYKEVFGAEELMRLDTPGGTIGHAEIKIGDSIVMLSDENPEMGAKGPGAYGGSPVMMHLYIEGVDGVVERAVAAGAELVRPVQDQFYGDRSGMIKDPFGYVWNVSMHVEDVSPEEIERRMAEMCKEG